MLERITYRGWNNAYRISNCTVDLIVLADVGPRIIWYGFTGRDNLLHEVPEHAGLTGGNEFRLYGGHRLWVSPEVERTYFPDNLPLAVSRQGDAVHFKAPVESASPGTNLQKELTVEMEPAGSCVRLTHRVTNCDRRPTELAPWAPTMMRAGGRAILPMPMKAPMDNDHLQPVSQLVLWSYTDFCDPRWKVGPDYVQLAQNSKPAGRFQEQMTGIFNPAGWVAYFHQGTLFAKRAAVIPGARYPDLGCNLETFTNPDFLEVETLGPLVELKPGEDVVHVETWSLFRDVPAGEDEAWIRSAILPLVPSNQ